MLALLQTGSGLLLRSALLVLALSSVASAHGLHAQSVAEQRCDDTTVDTQGPQTAKAARAFLVALQAAVRAQDKQKIADMVRYPLFAGGFDKHSNSDKPYYINDRKTFLAEYDRLFNAHVRKAILDQSVQCLFANMNGEMIGLGEIWFSEGGDGFKIDTVTPTAP